MKKGKFRWRPFSGTELSTLRWSRDTDEAMRPSTCLQALGNHLLLDSITSHRAMPHPASGIELPPVDIGRYRQVPARQVSGDEVGWES